MDVLTKEQRRRNMQAIKSKGTKIEILLGKALWQKGFRYRKNDKSVTGKPDFTFKKHKLAIFCDSEFWHGKDLDALKKRLDVNKEFWINKIINNKARDERTNQTLINEGWTVIRFWERDINKNLDDCVLQIEAVMNATIK